MNKYGKYRKKGNAFAAVVRPLASFKNNWFAKTCRLHVPKNSDRKVPNLKLQKWDNFHQINLLFPEITVASGVPLYSEIWHGETDTKQ